MRSVGSLSEAVVLQVAKSRALQFGQAILLQSFELVITAIGEEFHYNRNPDGSCTIYHLNHETAKLEQVDFPSEKALYSFFNSL